MVCGVFVFVWWLFWGVLWAFCVYMCGRFGVRFVRLWVFSVGCGFRFSRGGVCLASFSPCHYCLKIEGGGVAALVVHRRSFLLSRAFSALGCSAVRLGHRRS